MAEAVSLPLPHGLPAHVYPAPVLPVPAPRSPSSRRPLQVPPAGEAQGQRHAPVVPVSLVGEARHAVAVAADTPTEVLFQFRCEAIGVALLTFEAYEGGAMVDGMQKPLEGLGLQDPVLLGTSFAVEAPEEVCVCLCGWVASALSLVVRALPARQC